MIITHTTNKQGARRIYLGGKSSLECWVQPAVDGIAWSFHLDAAVTGNAVSQEDQRASAIAILISLANELAVLPQDLKAVPFERIAALHSSNPFENHRMPTPKQQLFDQCFMSTRPNVTRPKADFRSSDFFREPSRSRR